ncbi:hypothetical protein FGRMN_6763 [Fusarium graminum]|nr:hypothetical protein FGRMN_6763 [Fusarium graminum]
MAALPSYQDAVSADWLRLVVPYIACRDYPSLCRVDSRFWAVFAPRLWSRIPGSAGVATYDSERDLEWLFGSVLNHLSRARPETRSLVRVLDVRSVRGTYSLNTGNSFNDKLRDAIKYLPNLSCVFADGHQDLDPSEFLSEAGPQIQLLSMADCSVSLTQKFVSSLRSLVYLDLSRVPGSLRPLLQLGDLPELRVLRIQGKEVDDATAEMLATRFGTRLWSLDVSNNKLTDMALDSIRTHCLCPVNLRSDENYDVEGKLEFGSTSAGFGTWIRIDESEWSGSFTHPNRHLVDAPLYDLHDTLPQEFVCKRSDGKSPGKSDAAEAVCRGLQGEDLYVSPATNLQASQGLTHLSVSGNQISSLGISKLLTLGRGHLQELSCDSMLLVPPSGAASVWPKAAKLHGFYATCTLRPVFSSNLRALTLHHSLVTQIPTLEMDGLSTVARLCISEKAISPRAERAFPEAFVPDMNPRITSLTLTRIPRRSSGPLVSKLIAFLRLLSAQERAVFDMSSRRGPSVVAGLRHFRLEFESDPYDEEGSEVGDIDAEGLLDSGDARFSFFDDRVRGSQQQDDEGSVELGQSPDSTDFPTPHLKMDQQESEFLDMNILVDGKPTKMQVWIGPKDSINPLVQSYRKIALHYRVRDHVGPASPAQIRAGVPSSALVFHTAWCMTLMPPEIKDPSQAELHDMGMKDVLAELKQFRSEGRAKYLSLQREFGGGTVPPGPPHEFWLGNLEVSTGWTALRGKTGSYWR